MQKVPWIIRNDDVMYDTDIGGFREFCELCDSFGVRILQAVTPMGRRGTDMVRMTNEQIISIGNENIFQNKELIDYLKSRNDLIAVHGLWHTHQPNEKEVKEAKRLLRDLNPTYFVPPFNEGEYGDEVCGLTVSAKTQSLEDHLFWGTPVSPIVYLHSWRFGERFKLGDLKQCLTRLLG